MVIVGKASPNPVTGEIEYFLTDFCQMLRQKGRFVYAWSFNPDQAAIDQIRQSLDHEDVFLYLPGANRRSELRMKIRDFHHNRHGGTACPSAWDQFCIAGLRGLRAFHANTSQQADIHIWFLIDAICNPYHVNLEVVGKLLGQPL